MTPASVRANYRRALAKVGKDVVIRRYSGTGAGRAIANSATALARVAGYEADELAGTIVQGDSKIIVLAEDLETESFPLPIRSTDKCVVDGKELAIISPDPQTRQIAGVVVAWDLQCRG